MLCLKPQLGAHHPYLHRMNETFLKFDEEMRKAAASAGKTSGITEVMQGKHIVQQPPSGASLKV